MSVNEFKKLKRGLEDISDLFRPAEGPLPQAKENTYPLRGFQIISLVCPDAPSLSMLLNAWLATHLAGEERTLPIVTLKSGWGEGIQHHSHHHTPKEKRIRHLMLSREEFYKMCESRFWAIPTDLSASFLFLHFNPLDPHISEQLFLMVDKIVIYIRPLLRSLTESYKLLKRTLACNRRLDYYLLFDGDREDSRGRLIFEKLAGMASNHLGIQLYWLGNAKLMDIIQGSDAYSIAWNHLMLDPIRNVSCPEKIALENYLINKTD